MRVKLIKSNPLTIFFSIFLLLFIGLIITPFLYNNKSLLKNIPDNLAWAQIDPNLDSDGDGISDKLENESDPNRDTDLDGTKDFLDKDSCTLPPSSGAGSISLQLWLYECDDGSNCDLIKYQDIIYFTECSPVGTEEIDLPSSYGNFPYGLWRFRVNLSPDFKYYGDYEIFHKIFLEIFFPGPTKPLSSEYWAHEYDKDKKRVEWKEYSQDLFSPSIEKHSITILLSDSRPSESGTQDIAGYGDSNPVARIIDHEGGLLWPIEVEGRCFIDYIFSKKTH